MATQSGAGVDMLALLRAKMADPRFLDQLSQSEIDPGALMTAIPPQGMEALYQASPQQSRVPLTERQGMQPAGQDWTAAMMGAAAAPQQQAAPRPAVGAPPRSPGGARAQVQQPLPVGVRGTALPSIGELLAGR